MLKDTEMTKRSIHMRLLLKRATAVDIITAWLTQLRCNVDNGVQMRFQSLKNEGMIGHARHAPELLPEGAMGPEQPHERPARISST